jgi:tryptophan halogenase
MKNLVVVGSGQSGLIAALLVRHTIPGYANITVISSSDIPPVAIGESSTEQWDSFEQIVGMSRRETIRQCDATFKYGIRFMDWTNHTPDYMHSVSSPQLYSNQFNSLYSYIDASKLLLTPALSPRGLTEGLVTNFDAHDDRILKQVNQLHFDTHKLNKYLRNFCVQDGIEFVDAEVQGIERDSHTGDITKLVTSNGNYSADFVIDASGFNKTVLSMLGEVHVTTFEDILPCNSALVFQTPPEADSNLKPYTLAKALSAGWRWEIPTYDRRGNGYVFSSNHITESQALEEIEKDLGIKIPDARLIEFTPHYVTNSWQFNCVAVGLASNFVEPLEATSIAATINQVRLLCSNLPTYKPNSASLRNSYLRTFEGIVDNMLAMVAMHYVSDRVDSPMWIEQQNRPKTDLLQSLIEIMEHRGPEDHDIPHTGFELFRPVHFWHVGQGQGLINQENSQIGLNAHGSEQRAKDLVDEMTKNHGLSGNVDHRRVITRARIGLPTTPYPKMELGKYQIERLDN